MNSNELREFILRNFHKQLFHGYQVFQALEEMRISISTTRLYKVLNGMLSEGLLKDKWVKSEAGPQKRVYKLTKLGHQERNKILRRAISIVHEFYLEYINSFPKEKNRVYNICTLLSKHVSKNGTIGSLVCNFSESTRYILKALQKAAHKAKKYMIVTCGLPSSGYEGWSILEGRCSNIPLKRSFLDLLFLPGLDMHFCKNLDIDECINVLKPDGTLAFLTPAILLKKRDDAMAIGEFIEFLMHASVDGQIPLFVWNLIDDLKNRFKSMEIKEYGDIALVLAKQKKES